MSQMFSACKYFNQSLNFNTSKVVNMEGMFYDCENLNQPLNFDTLKVENMSFMFEGCESLEHLPKFYKNFGKK